MRLILIVVLLTAILGWTALSSGCAGCDQRIRESTDMGFDTAIKGTDIAREGALIANLCGDPVLEWYYKLGHFTGSVSHSVATLTGKLRTQELIDQAIGLARKVKGIKEVISELEVDPTIEELPFDW